MRIAYLDHNATTPVPEPVVEAMLPYLRERYGNPSSTHVLGREARDGVEAARAQVAQLLGCRTHDLTFMSSGTEANNTALYAWLAQAPDKRHIVIGAAEHSSVMEFAVAHERLGYEVTRVPVDRDSRVDPATVAEALRPDTACAAVMWANNETGVVYPIEAIAETCARAGVPVHVDAVQVAGKRPMRVRDLPIDSLTISGHKMYASKGSAALYLRSGRRYRPLLWGGAQEHARRAGTENVAAIVGLGTAAALVERELATEPARQGPLRDRLEARVREIEPAAVLHGATVDRLANTSSFHIPNLDGEAMVRMFSEEGVCLSTGAACEAGTGEPSHVMLAMGLRKDESHGALRVSLGRGTVEEDVELFCEALPRVIERLRAILPAAPVGR